MPQDLHFEYHEWNSLLFQTLNRIHSRLLNLLSNQEIFPQDFYNQYPEHVLKLVVEIHLFQFFHHLLFLDLKNNKDILINEIKKYEMLFPNDKLILKWKNKRLATYEK